MQDLIRKPIGFGKYKVQIVKSNACFYVSGFVDMDVTTTSSPKELRRS
jgi:hypothetical protein